MNDDILRAGVNPGSPGTQTEIKTLIVAVLSSDILPNTSGTMSFMQLYETFSEHSLVNYFDLVAAVEQLCASGHIEHAGQTEAGGELYRATALGQQAGKELASSIPPSVREKAISSAGKVLRRGQRESEVEITITPAPEGGFVMEFAIPDSVSDLVRFSLYVATQEDCARMRKRFLNAPLFIYGGVLALLTGNRDVLGKVFPEEELF